METRQHDYYPPRAADIHDILAGEAESLRKMAAYLWVRTTEDLPAGSAIQTYRFSIAFDECVRPKSMKDFLLQTQISLSRNGYNATIFTEHDQVPIANVDPAAWIYDCCRRFLVIIRHA